MHLTVSISGGPPAVRGVIQYWWWPARPARGQQVHLIAAGPTTREEVTFTEPAVTTSSPAMQLLPASGYLMDPVDKSWQPVTHYAFEGVVAATATKLLDESYLRDTYLQQTTVVNAHASIGGRPAIEVSVPTATSTLSVWLWVDAQTYLPLRQLKLFGGVSYPETKMVYDYQFLPATKANLAALSAPPRPAIRSTTGPDRGISRYGSVTAAASSRVRRRPSDANCSNGRW
jgi:hypothetical protein